MTSEVCRSIKVRVSRDIVTEFITSTGNTGEQNGQIKIKWGCYWGSNYSSLQSHTGFYTEQVRKTGERFSVLEYYTTDSACP